MTRDVRWQFGCRFVNRPCTNYVDLLLLDVLDELAHATRRVAFGVDLARLQIFDGPRFFRRQRVEGGHKSSLVAGSPGVIHGSMTYLLQDDQGQILEAHSISAGLDYPGVGPEHAYFKDAGLVRYVSITDDEALEAVHLLASVEGIIPALESAHGLAWIAKEAASLQGKTVVLNLSGRGDKDVQQIVDADE